jgi:hypothetical protein
MSHRHEQKYLLHNWSDRRYRDHPQSPRAVLRVRLDSGAIATKRTIFVGVMAHREDRERFVVRARRSSGFVRLGREAPSLLPLACARSMIRRGFFEQ